MNQKNTDWASLATKFARQGLEIGAEIMGTTAKELAKLAETLHPDEANGAQQAADAAAEGESAAAEGESAAAKSTGDDETAPKSEPAPSS